MAGFQYRLKKVFELRERKKKEQEQKVIQAQRAVRDVELRIEEKKNEIRMVRESMFTSHHTLMGTHDDYLHLMHQQLEELYQELEEAKEILKKEKELLVKAQADLEALVKHRDKMREEWLEEQKQKEMKQLDEVASQRYFRAKQAELEELQEDYELAGIEYDPDDLDV